MSSGRTRVNIDLWDILGGYLSPFLLSLLKIEHVYNNALRHLLQISLAYFFTSNSLNIKL